jgi:hypothetical protein
MAVFRTELEGMPGLGKSDLYGVLINRHSTSLRFPFAYLANKRRIAFGKAWKRRNCVAKSAKPLIVIQRVQIPPDQSRADRSVVSLAIHRATGGCEA